MLKRCAGQMAWNKKIGAFTKHKTDIFTPISE